MTKRLELRMSERAAFLRSYTHTGPALWTAEDVDGTHVQVFPARGDRAILIAFLGTAGKPAVHCSYRHPAEAIATGEQLVTNRRAHADRVRARRTERTTFQTTMQVGTVLSSSWGYDQTNIDYYEVVSISPSRQSVTLRPIAARSHEDGFMQGTCWPLAGEYIGPASTHRVQPGESVKVRDFGVWAHPWKGAPNRWTAYA